MTDYFALLKVPRRPWLDADVLKSGFLALSAEVHPDRFHNATAAEKEAAHQRYLELNAAYQCLREPKERLRHLLELETGAAPAAVQRIPPDLMDLFMNVGQACQGADRFLAEKAKATSPMVRAALFERGLEWTDKLMALQQQTAARREALDARIKAADAAWSAADSATRPLGELEAIYRELGFVNRWTEQLQERIVQAGI